MHSRFQAKYESILPEVDHVNIQIRHTFAPQYSQIAFMYCKQSESRIGNYLSEQNFQTITHQQRKTLVKFLEQLQLTYQLKFETHLIAVSVADRYLAQLSKQNILGPNSLVLASTCVMIAAKINEHSWPSFSNLKANVLETYDLSIHKEEFIALEYKILKELEFDVQYTTPLFFLDRFFTIC